MAFGANIGTFLATSALVMLQVLLLSIVGLILGHFPQPHGILTKQVMAGMYWTSIPALMVVKFATNLDMALLNRTWALICWGPIHLGVSLLVGSVGMKVAKVPPGLRYCLLLSTAFQNCVSLPLVVVGAVLQQRPEYAHDAATAARSVMYIFVYSIPWNLIFWSIGRTFMEKDGVAGAVAAPEAHAAPVPDADVHRACTEEEITEAVNLTELIAAVEPDIAARIRAEEGQALRVVSPAMDDQQAVPPSQTEEGVKVVEEATGETPRPTPVSDDAAPHAPSPASDSVFTQVSEGGSWQQAIEDQANVLLMPNQLLSTGVMQSEALEIDRARARSKSRNSRQRSSSEFSTREVQPRLHARIASIRKAAMDVLGRIFTPPVTGIFVGAIIGLQPQLRTAYFDYAFPLANALAELSQPTIMMMNLVMAGSLYHGLLLLRAAWRGDAAGRDVGSMSALWKMCGAVSVTRLVISPSILLLLHYFADQACIPVLCTTGPDSDPIMRLVLYLQTIFPAAQTLLTQSSQLGLTRASSIMAIVFVFQYLCSILTIALFMSGIMSIVFAS